MILWSLQYYQHSAFHIFPLFIWLHLFFHLPRLTTSPPKSARHTNSDLRSVIHLNQLSNHVPSKQCFFSFFSAPPKFLRTPNDQTGVQGGVASFICQATGDPRPKIVWNKKGKRVSNQRFEVLGLLFWCKMLDKWMLTIVTPPLITPSTSSIATH